LAEFYRLPTRDNRGETALAQEELITEVIIPVSPARSRSTYVKIADRGSWDFALVSVAVQLTFSGEIVEKARVVLGGVATIPWQALGVEEALEGKILSPEVVGQAARATADGARPLEHNVYKIDLAQGAVHRAIQSLG
jgi:xanthine dehydrogenase YagS FAD-binding subunit